MLPSELSKHGIGGATLALGAIVAGLAWRGEESRNKGGFTREHAPPMEKKWARGLQLGDGRLACPSRRRSQIDEPTSRDCTRAQELVNVLNGVGVGTGVLVQTIV